jgi:hypothetical protein
MLGNLGERVLGRRLKRQTGGEARSRVNGMGRRSEGKK